MEDSSQNPGSKLSSIRKQNENDHQEHGLGLKRYPEYLESFYTRLLTEVSRMDLEMLLPATMDQIRSVCAYLTLLNSEFETEIADAARNCALSEETFQDVLNSVTHYIPTWRCLLAEEMTVFYARRFYFSHPDEMEVKSFVSSAYIETLRSTSPIPLKLLIGSTLGAYRVKNGLSFNVMRINLLMNTDYSEEDFLVGRGIMTDQYASRIKRLPVHSQSTAKLSWCDIEPGKTPGTVDLSYLTFEETRKIIDFFAGKLKTPPRTVALANELFENYFSIFYCVNQDMMENDLLPVCYSCVWIAEKHHGLELTQNELAMICIKSVEVLNQGLREIQRIFPASYLLEARNTYSEPAMTVIAKRAGFNEIEVAQTLKFAFELSLMSPLSHFLSVAAFSLFLKGVEFGRDRDLMKKITLQITRVNNFNRFRQWLAVKFPNKVKEWNL